MRIRVSYLLLAALAGCVESEPTDDPGAIDDPATTLGVTDDDLALDEQEMELPVIEEAARTDGYHRLHATDYNLANLRQACYDSSLQLGWNCPSNHDGAHAHFRHRWEVPTNDVEVADNGGTFPGECVSLVKAASKNNTVTADWKPGANVFASLGSGTAIATFPGGHYFGHAAIFLAYVRDGHGNVIGIRVADENWGRRVVKRHVIHKGSGSSVSNANNFHAILVP